MKAWLKKQIALWRKRKLIIAAAVLSGGEAAINLGLDLPGAQWIPAKLRGLAIAVLTAAAFFMRWKAASKEKRDAS